jgi:hypothetical protein
MPCAANRDMSPCPPQPASSWRVTGQLASAGRWSLMATLISCLRISDVAALPGRSWAPTVTLAYPGVLGFGSPRLEVDPLGYPLLVANTVWADAPGGFWNVFGWRDSSWAHRFTSDQPAFFLPEMASSITATRHMAWLSQRDDGSGSLLVAEVLPDRILPADTAMLTTMQSSEYDAAASSVRRWVVRSQQRKVNLDITFAVRTAYSDTPGVWHDLPQLGIDEDHCAIAPLSDTSAMVVYAGESGLRWAVVEGSRWTQSGILDTRPFVAAHPRFRIRPSGGLWLLWTDRRWVRVSHYKDGVWSRGDSLTAIHLAGQTFLPAWCDPSIDSEERPVLAWGDLGYGQTSRDVGVVAFPTDSGWAPGEEIPGSDNMFLTPYVARDRNGDAWVGWRVRGGVMSRWTHTYVSATTTKPFVHIAGPDRVVSWNLSEPAPDSWWAVLRADKRGLFEEVARVEAGSGVEMSWTDSSPGHGNLRYKIRRESVDTRYLWESEETSWPPKTQKQLTLISKGLIGHPRQLELTGAEAGTLEVRVHDVQGRVVWEQKAIASGSGRDVLELVLASRGLGAGIYFATARDAAGNAASPIKLVILR